MLEFIDGSWKKVAFQEQSMFEVVCWDKQNESMDLSYILIWTQYSKGLVTDWQLMLAIEKCVTVHCERK